MHEIAPGCHPVHRAWPNGLVGPKTVAMVQRPIEQPSNRRQPDMGVLAHVDSLACRQRGGPQMIEEDERPGIAPLCKRQQTAQGEPTQIPLARRNDHLDGVGHGNFLRLHLSMDDSAHDGKVSG